MYLKMRLTLLLKPEMIIEAALNIEAAPALLKLALTFDIGKSSTVCNGASMHALATAVAISASCGH